MNMNSRCISTRSNHDRMRRRRHYMKSIPHGKQTHTDFDEISRTLSSIYLSFYLHISLYLFACHPYKQMQCRIMNGYTLLYNCQFIELLFQVARSMPNLAATVDAWRNSGRRESQREIASSKRQRNNNLW